MSLREHVNERGAIRMVAAFEAFKGFLALLVGSGLLIEQQRLGRLALELVHYLHLNPLDKYPHLFVMAARDLQNRHLWTMVAIVLLYATMRFVEAYGLFREAAWAEVFAAVSGAVYIPLELSHVVAGPDVLNVAVLVTNLLVVALMVHALFARRRKRNQASSAQ